MSHMQGNSWPTTSAFRNFDLRSAANPLNPICQSLRRTVLFRLVQSRHIQTWNGDEKNESGGRRKRARTGRGKKGLEIGRAV